MEIYTDGSCLGNGKANNTGGFGLCAIDNNEVVFVYRKDCENTTNNEMELKALLCAFLFFGNKDSEFCRVNTVYSDSAYAVNTLTTWMFSWANNGWRKSDKKVPENLEIIKTFYSRWQEGYRIDIQKVKGHNGNKWNELADALATGRIKTLEEAQAWT